MKVPCIPATPPEVIPTPLCGNIVSQHGKILTTKIAPSRLRKDPANCHSADAAGDEESGIALKTIRARSFAAAQDDSIGVVLRSLLVAEKKGRKGNLPIS
jgi:hypothetical protein